MGMRPTVVEVEPPNQSPSAQASPEPPPRLLAEPAKPGVWAQRLFRWIEAALCVWTGALVMILPWLRLWTENPLLTPWPTLKQVLTSTFVRGVISGVGLLDVWAGVFDAVHTRRR
jgi:hypothetical protein